MGNSNIDNVRAQMRKGVLEYCILSILYNKEAYASTILEELKAANMIVVEGTLYPLLIRQKNQGLLSYRWEESTQGPPRKYYCITGKGVEQLKDMDAAWQELVETIKTLKTGKPVEDDLPVVLGGSLTTREEK